MPTVQRLSSAAHHRAIQTTSLTALLWQIGAAAFLLSSVLDNLATTIVMVPGGDCIDSTSRSAASHREH